MRFYLLFIFIFFIGFVSAAAPLFSDSQYGMQIEYPRYEAVKLLNDHRFHVHVINQTSTITNKTASCFIHLYNQTGYDIAYGYLEFEAYNNVDFAWTARSGNFSTVGEYNYVLQCNSSTQIAFIRDSIIVTPNGEVLSTGKSVIYIGLLTILLCIFTLLSYASISIEGENTRADNGELISINYKKYIKMLTAVVAYVSFVGITYFAWALSFGILYFTEMSNFFYFLFRLSFIMILPVIIVMFVFAIIKFMRERKLQEMLNRGLTAR